MGAVRRFPINFNYRRNAPSRKLFLLVVPTPEHASTPAEEFIDVAKSFA
jgi:hypothetical protein